MFTQLKPLRSYSGGFNTVEVVVSYIARKNHEV